VEVKSADPWCREDGGIDEVQGVDVEEDIDVTALQFSGEVWVLHARSREHRNAQFVGDRRHGHSAAVALVMLVTSEDGSEMMRGLFHQSNCLYASSFLGSHNNVHAFKRSRVRLHPLRCRYRWWGVARYPATPIP